MTRISDVMTRGVRTLAPTDTLQLAAQAMDELDIGAVPVCDGDALVGIVTDRDIVVRGVAQGCAADRTPVKDAMSTHVECCYDDQSVDEIAARMRERRVRRVAVLDRERRLVGMVALADLAGKGEEAAAGSVLSAVSQPAAPDRSGQSAASGAAGGGSAGGGSAGGDRAARRARPRPRA